VMLWNDDCQGANALPGVAEVRCEAQSYYIHNSTFVHELQQA
jgi:hypothetical protein